MREDKKSILYSIGSKFSATAVVILATVMIVATLSSILLTRKNLQREMAEHLESDSSIARLILSNRLKQLQSITDLTSADNTVKITLDLGIIPQLEEYLGKTVSRNTLDFFMITNETGHLISCSQAVSKNSSFLQPQIEKALHGESTAAISLGFYNNTGKSYRVSPSSDSANELMMVAVSPIRMKGRITGTISLGRLIANEIETIRLIKENTEADMMIWQSGKGIILSSLTEAGIAVFQTCLKQSIKDVTLNKLNEETIHTPDILINEKNFLIAVHPVRDSHSKTVAFMAVAKSTKTLKLLEKNTIAIMILISLIGICVAVFLTFIAGRSISRPIKKTVEAMSAVTEKGDLSVHVDMNAKGEVGKLVSTFNDMVATLKESTEKRRGLVSTLKESEDRLRKILESVQTGIIIIYEETHEILDVNPAFIKMIGSSREQVIGSVCNKFICPEEDGACPVTDLNQDVDSSECVLIKASGEEIPILKTVSRIMLAGQACLLESIVDITENKKLQAQLQHAQKMESIGIIASGVAHNFRNILAGISIDSQLIETKHKDVSGLHVITQRLISAVKKGARLVEELMLFSRKEHGGKKVLKLDEILRETYLLISRTFDKKIDIRISIPDIIPVSGDNAGLSQVFMNLCTNARDAMPEGGKLLVEAREEGGRALVIISDTGEGMDKETMGKCFDPFFTTKETDKGTGLGLSTTYGIVKDHGGDIHVYSELNKGTTFKLYFPLALFDEQGEQEGFQGLLHGKGEKVLVVDDEMEIFEALVDMIRGLDYRVASVTSGKAAIDKYRSWQPDVVLLDRNMPEMDGITCAKKIMEHDPGANIILISGYEEDGMNGIDNKTKELIKGYLIKPVDFPKLSWMLAMVLERD